MPDREKVNKGLHQHCECSLFDRCGECPYYEFSDEQFSCRDRLLEDVLLLLKEQEAVKPEREHSGSGVTWWNVCGNCKTAINPNDKFCHECGRPVLWGGW